MLVENIMKERVTYLFGFERSSGPEILASKLVLALTETVSRHSRRRRAEFGDEQTVLVTKRVG